MRKIWMIILRVTSVLLVVLSAYLMLTSNIQLRINNTHAMTKHIVREVVQDSDNTELGLATNFLEATGLEDELLKSFPKKYHLDLSYADLYKLSTKYDETGELTAKDFNLTSNNRLGQIVNQYIVKEINRQLKEDSREVYHVITIYRYSIFVVILIYLLAALLMIFGKYWASIPLSIATVGVFGILWYFTGEATNALQEQVYHGIFVNMTQGIWAGLIIGVLVALIWPILLKSLSKVIDRSEGIES